MRYEYKKQYNLRRESDLANQYDFKSFSDEIGKINLYIYSQINENKMQPSSNFYNNNTRYYDIHYESLITLARMKENYKHHYHKYYNPDTYYTDDDISFSTLVCFKSKDADLLIDISIHKSYQSN